MPPKEKLVYFDADQLRAYGRMLRNSAMDVDSAYGSSQNINIAPGTFEWANTLDARYKERIEGTDKETGLGSSLATLSGILGTIGKEIDDIVNRYLTTEDLNKGDAARLWDIINGIAKYDSDVKNIVPPDAGSPPGPPGAPPP